MKKTVSMLFAAFMLTFCAMAAEKIVWDFSQAEPNSKFKLYTRGDTKIADGALQVKDASGKVGGAAMNSIYPEVVVDKAFRLTIEFSLDGKFNHKTPAMLWDSKYVTMPNATPAHKNFHRGFQLYLNPAIGGNYRICAAFGYGTASQQVQANMVSIEPDVKHTLVMEFNASDRATFTFDGNLAGTCILNQGFLAPPFRTPVLGDRQGSSFWPLGGSIYKVTLEKLEWQPLQIGKSPVDRKVFLRGEENAAYQVNIRNFSQQNCQDLTLEVTSDMGVKKIAVPKVDAGKINKVALAIDSNLLPGDYALDMALLDKDGKKLAVCKDNFTIVPQPGDYMPVMLWGGLPLSSATRIGFTHMGMSLVPHSGGLGPSGYAAYTELLDEYLKNGVYTYAPITTDRRFTQQKRFLRTGYNNSTIVPASVDPSREELQKELLNAVAASAQNLGSHPGWTIALSISEERDRTNVDFSGRMNDAFRQYSGYDMPASIRGKYPTARRANLVSVDRIIPDDDKELNFYRWFWTRGDGWNDLHSKITAELHKYIKHDFTTFHDPAVRVPLVWGSGGKCDAIAHWTYTNPDPIKIGQTTDELMAMADGYPGQKVFSMTQIIWYRSAAAPGSNVKNKPEWLAREPKAVYMTLPPDALRIALWSKISRKIAGIQYHGANSLTGEDNKHQYRYTNSESQKALQELVHNVIKPLGPVLKKADEQPLEVAILETFPATLYAQQHFPVGWSRNWAADLHLALQWAHFPVGVIFDDHLLTNKNIDNLKVLFIPGAEVMTRSVVDKVKELQSKGVIIVGDEFTPPEISVDLRLKSIRRKDLDPRQAKADFQQLGRQIAAMLKKHYTPRYSADNQDVVLRTRQAGEGEYLFMVNDKRTFGDYIGQWKRVMEKGLPNTATIRIKSNAAAAYDAVKHQPIAIKSANGVVEFVSKMPAAGGQLIILLPEAVEQVNTSVSATEVARGEAFSINAQICGRSGAIKALLPVEVTLLDANGKTLPGSGYYAAENGQLTVNETAAANMTAGQVTVKVRCLASGKVGEAVFTVK
ncbi:MAG: hypothetical protein E7056_08560 [Lentisphaerae bacterium]|nr:hypothetical protein [Lentisphaerota bacterium]